MAGSFEALRGSIDELAALRAKVRVSSALGDLGAPRDGEAWIVDLEKPRFELTAGEEVLFAGPCQLVGTWVEGDGFLWGFVNASISSAGTSRLRERLEAMPDVAPALTTRKLIGVDIHDVELVANALALRAGFTGAASAPRAEAVALIAVDLVGPEAEGIGREPWCTSCGRLRRAVRALVAGPEGIAMCNVCAELLGDILGEDPPGELGERPADAPPAPDFPPSLSYCLLCGERKGRLIMMGEMGVCRDCAAIVIEVLGSSP